MLSQLSKWILNRLGWEVSAELPDTGKYIIIAAPHTSNWDFPLGILAAEAMRVRIHWIGKHTLFRWPYGWFFRAIGGTPVYRHKTLNMSQQLAAIIAENEQFVLVLAPEGTRSKTDHWKSGFYYIAEAANVPVCLGYLDFGHKRVGIAGCFKLSGNMNQDLDIIRTFYADKEGKIPAKASTIAFKH